MKSRLKGIICIISIIILIVCNASTLYYFKIDSNSLSNISNEFVFDSKNMMEKPDKEFNQEMMQDIKNKPENVDELNNVNIYNENAIKPEELENSGNLSKGNVMPPEMESGMEFEEMAINNIDFKSRLITLYIILLCIQAISLAIITSYLICSKFGNKNINKKDTLLIMILIFVILLSVIGIIDYCYVCLV